MEAGLWSLLDEPWLSVRAADQGDTSASPSSVEPGGHDVGVRELLLEAHRFRDFEVDIPTQRPAIFRQLLLPLVVDALDFPKNAADWSERFSRGSFTKDERERLSAYFDAHGHLFHLFAADGPAARDGDLDERPPATDLFAQVPGLRTAKGETKTSALLVPTAAQGNNVPLFSPRTDADPLALTPAEAARWLLHTHCWDTGAIKTGVVDDDQAKGGKTTGNPVGPLGQLGVVMPRGTTLYETLLLNIPYGTTRLAGDLPQWSRRERGEQAARTHSTATPNWQARTAAGPLEVWTWQARRVLLVPERIADGSLRVTRAVLAAGDRLLRVSQDHETHTAWREESPASYAKRKGKAAEVPRTRPLRHREGRAAWRGLDSLLAVDRSFDATKAPNDQHGYYTSELLKQLSAARQEYGTPRSDYALQLELTGVTYSSKLGAVEDLFFDEIPLPLAALDRAGRTRGALLGAVEQAEELSLAANRLAADLRRAAGADAPRRGTWEYPGEALLHALDPRVRALLVELRKADEDGERIQAELAAWEEIAAREAWKVADQVLTNAAAPGLFQGRVVAKGDASRVYRLSEAEAGFRKSLNKILWRRTERRAEGRRARAAEAQAARAAAEAEAAGEAGVPGPGAAETPGPPAPDAPTPEATGPHPVGPDASGRHPGAPDSPGLDGRVPRPDTSQPDNPPTEGTSR
ncbi:type I-E CRISPR-associated protein Cse1/CasA [Streptomyces sp. NPDC057702]|uniref:type I-E CRISPR-associated protein Cse1/CasA n=1 Tax=unclassified Streptomyces TaxID=2593676 RepID=UPI0036A86300